MPTPPEVDSTMFYQMSLDKPQEKPRPLNRPNKNNVDHQRNSSQSKGRTIQLKIMSIREINTMIEQTGVVMRTSLLWIQPRLFVGVGVRLVFGL
jgi:hypothetical protein